MVILSNDDKYSVPVMLVKWCVFIALSLKYHRMLNFLVSDIIKEGFGSKVYQTKFTKYKVLPTQYYTS